VVQAPARALALISIPTLTTSSASRSRFPPLTKAASTVFDPKTPPPSRDDRCLDGWQGTVELTLDWHFYILPFSELRQGGYGKRAPYFNLKAIDTVAFTFIVGWADVYIDNVSLYRRKP